MEDDSSFVAFNISVVDDILKESKGSGTTYQWEKASSQPAVIYGNLPLRQCVLEYEQIRGSSYWSDNKIEPEVRYVRKTITDSFVRPISIPKSYYPIMSLPWSGKNGCPASVMCSPNDTLNYLSSTILALRHSRSQWDIPVNWIVPTQPHVTLYRLLACKNLVPLHAYTIMGYNSVCNTRDECGYYEREFVELSENTRHVGIYGSCSDNSLIDVRPYDEAEEGEQFDLSKRITRAEWAGFIDCTYTPTSIEANRIRKLVHGVRYRLITDELLSNTEMIFDVVKRQTNNIQNSDWLFHSCGYSTLISSSMVLEIVDRRLHQLGMNTPSLWIDEEKKVCILSISAGCLVRPVVCSEDSISDSHSLWLDSTMFNSTFFRTILGNSIPDPCSDLYQFCATSMRLTPFFEYDEPPRTLLGSSMSTQAICRPYVELFSTISPVNVVKPIVRTKLLDMICGQINSESGSTLPGFPLLTLFANFKSNYEDAIIVSDKINTLGIFHHKSVVFHPVDKDHPDVKVGDKFDNSTHWWRPYDNGTVLFYGMSKNKSRYVSASLECKELRVGDKIATQHGQKFTISEIIPHEQMPLCYDPVRSIEFRPLIVMASSSVTNRRTLGQVLEGWAAVDTIGVANINFDPRVQQQHCTVGIADRIPSKTPSYTCRFTGIAGTEFLKFPPSHGSMRGEYVVADYGVCHYWLLAHLVRDKQHFMSKEPMGLGRIRGRMKGSSVTMGEMEYHCLLAKGMYATISELLDNSDMCIVDICSLCQRLIPLCDCPLSEKGSGKVKVRVRSSLIKFDLLNAVRLMGMVGTLSPGSEGMYEQKTAKSFRYIA